MNQGRTAVNTANLERGWSCGGATAVSDHGAGSANNMSHQNDQSNVMTPLVRLPHYTLHNTSMPLRLPAQTTLNTASLGAVTARDRACGPRAKGPSEGGTCSQSACLGGPRLDASSRAE